MSITKNIPQEYTNLSATEYKALSYLFNKGIQIYPNKIHKWFLPDFIDDKGIGYEIKKININGGGIQFTNGQINNFRNDTQILIFKHFKFEPLLIISFENLKPYLSKSGSCSIIRFLAKPQEAEDNFSHELLCSTSEGAYKKIGI